MKPFSLHMLVNLPEWPWWAYNPKFIKVKIKSNMEEKLLLDWRTANELIRARQLAIIE